MRVTFSARQVIASLALRQIMELTVLDRGLTVANRRDVLQHYLDTATSVRETLLEQSGYFFVADYHVRKGVDS